MTSPSIAIVHDWLDTWRGGEVVLAELLGLFPQATLFSVVDFLDDDVRARIGGRRARTTFVQRLPGARRHFRAMLPIMPLAVGRLALEGFDLVISSSHAVAKGAPTRPHQLHVCLCYTPMRYAWDLRDQYLERTGWGHGMRGWVVRRVLDALRDWDLRTAARVNRFVAISRFIAERIRRCYGREATVIHPPVDTDFFTPGAPPAPPGARGYYFTAARMVPYKRIDLIVEAFRDLPERRLVVGGEGPEAARIRRLAGANVEFVGEVPRERLRELLRGARAFVFAAEEDFGLLPVEAQACGTPVIGYGRGGLSETVVTGSGERPTGVLFAEQTAAAISAAVVAYEKETDRYLPAACRDNAQRFAVAHFRARFGEFVDAAWREFRAQAR